nr:hypothetical protein [Tanacetum cinerariifolium]
MTTLAEHMIEAGADNRTSMLENSMYTSWASRMLLYIKGKEHGRMLNSVINGPLVYPTIKVDGVTRLKTYEELSDKEKLQDDCALRATNIILQGTKISYQERDCKLYNEFNKFASFKGETLHDYYMRFAQLMNDIHIIRMTMQQVQVNTKFLIGLQPEWSKFVTELKLAKKLKFNKLREDKIKVLLGMVQIAMLQMDDLDAFNFECDEALGASTFLMAHLSSYDSDVISKVSNSDNYINDIVPDMCVQEESYSEQLTFNPNLDIDITSDGNIISYEQYLQETKSAAVQNNTSSNQQNAMIVSVFDVLSDQVAKCTADNLKHKELDKSLTAKLESYKERVKQFKERQNVDLNNRKKYIKSQMNDMTLNVKNVVMHSNVHKMSSMNTNCLDNDNLALECLQMESDCLMELLISQDLLHTHVNTLATINDYKSMEQSYLDEYKETLTLKAELAKKNDMVKKSVYNELSN